MSVIAGNRTKKFNFIKLAPGSAPQHAKHHGARNRIIHDRQARISADNYPLRRYSQHISQKAPCFRYSVQQSVISAVNTRFGHQRRIFQNSHKIHFHIELGSGRLASRHVKLKALCLHFLILLIQILLESGKLFPAHLSICFHTAISSSIHERYLWIIVYNPMPRIILL